MREPAPIDESKLLTSDEVAELLAANPVLRQYAAECVLPAVAVGAEWRFRRSDLERWIREHGQDRRATPRLPEDN